MRRALLVGDDDARGLLAAVRSLADHGWRVGVITPSRRSLVVASRHVSAWHPLGDDVVASVASAVRSGGYDVVLPGGDSELLALSERRSEVGCVVPYGSRDSVRCILDKLSLASEAARFGVAVPATREATPAALASVSGPVVLKSRSHTVVRSETLVSDDPGALARAAEKMRSAGVMPLLQELATGPLIALTVVMDADHEVVAAVQQRAAALWPPNAGITARAETVPVDPGLLARLTGFLAGIGWSGLAEAQFLDADDGPTLIDVNGRCYGSLALATAAGVPLPAVWAATATGGSVPPGPAVTGVRYQWLYGDLRRGWREGRDLIGPLVHARSSSHSVWDRTDLRPAASYVRSLVRAARNR